MRAFAPVTLALALGALGCVSRPVQHEAGTPPQRYAGDALVVLPRSCVVERSVPARHFVERPLAERPTESQPAAKTARLQAMLDGLAGKPASGARPESECESPPEVGVQDWFLADLRATDATLQQMRERGASFVVVLEVHTVMACARHDDATALVHHGQLGVRPPSLGGPLASRWSPDDVCLEDEVKLSAWMFDATGAAVWGLTRDLLPTDEPGFVLDRVLDRVPVALPLRRHRGEFEVASAPGAGAPGAGAF
ncbi:MAG: hypothetical protein KIT84_01245 [Labilithrix sp.]|nr:hypothetical protein [Labilithrix sp.]MCW5809611.1 hypothetical protein [Labilithrix sp.]